ncbi:MAG: hypothetical protein HPY85_15950 [Anaerolineae bacterium]|nr:hypothetical protein [Anaerolineae bacterium]
MNFRCLETKLHIPTPRSGITFRARLQRMMQTGYSRGDRLMLVSAPAGYGKTTLVVNWLHEHCGQLLHTKRVAWLSLDQNDNDLGRFLGYLTAALQHVDRKLAESAQSLLDMPQIPPATAILDEIINDLLLQEQPILLILDDYHLIHQIKIHEALAYLVDHQPPNLHLVITTREDPPLPLARLRARGQMTEIRAAQLRFNASEAAAFFKETMHLELEAEAVEALEKRTEGWAVGLQLAALALQNLPDRQNFLADFSGSHRYIIDYLAEEVVRQQDEEIRQFLVRTCILDRFNADLCHAVSGHQNAQQVISALEQNNLFVVPLDDERNWYRYHHLFADYLRILLTEQEQQALMKKAAAWHEANDLLVDAVHYALGSGDTDFAADMIERALGDDTTWSSGNVSVLSAWLEVLPAQTIRNRPRLSLNASRIFYLLGRFEQAEECIRNTEALLKALPPDADTEHMLAVAALYYGSIASVRGESRKAIELTRYAQERIADHHHLLHARANFTLGLAHEVAEQSTAAVAYYLQSSKQATTAGVLFLAVHALGAAAQVQIKQGQLRQAEQSCRTAIQMAEGARIAPLGLIYSILGGIALHHNDLDSAEAYLEDGIALSRMGGLMDDTILGLSFRAELLCYQDKNQNALAVFDEVRNILHVFGVNRISIVVEAYLARIHLYSGNMAEANQWAARYQSIRSQQVFENADLILVRCLLACGELDAVPSILHPILEKADQAGRNLVVMEAMLLLAVYYNARNQPDAALEWLGKSLELAAPEHCIRIFLDERKALADLLPKARQFAPNLVGSLLETGQPEPATSPGNAALIDPLTEQECTVLGLLADGKTNQAIADALFISVGTAKWHVHNILQKLGVSNRAQAIVKARELGLA